MIDKNSLVENGKKYTMCHICFNKYEYPREREICIKCENNRLSIKNKKLDKFINN